MFGYPTHINIKSISRQLLYYADSPWSQLESTRLHSTHRGCLRVVRSAGMHPELEGQFQSVEFGKTKATRGSEDTMGAGT